MRPVCVEWKFIRCGYRSGILAYLLNLNSKIQFPGKRGRGDIPAFTPAN